VGLLCPVTWILSPYSTGFVKSLMKQLSNNKVDNLEKPHLLEEVLSW
jgi:hypothetical protein